MGLSRSPQVEDSEEEMVEEENNEIRDFWRRKEIIADPQRIEE